MKCLALISLLGCISAFSITKDIDCWRTCSTGWQSTSLKQSQDTDEFLRRWKDKKYVNLLESAFWTVTHDYSDFKHVEEVLKTFQTYFEALGKYEKGDRSMLDQLGGIKGFKDKLSGWLDDDDQAIRAFAAVLLGVSGDKTYAPQLATLLKKKELKNDHPRYDIGRAAIALGLLEAKEHTPDLVALLSSSNTYDRAGAAYGLGWLGSKDQAKAVAKLLNDEDEGVREAAKESLEIMGAADLIKGKKQER